MRSKFGSVEETFGSDIGPVVEILVHPFEIEKLRKRLSDAPVGEYGPACVEDQSVHARRHAAVECFLSRIHI